MARELAVGDRRQPLQGKNRPRFPEHRPQRFEEALRHVGLLDVAQDGQGLPGSRQAQPLEHPEDAAAVIHGIDLLPAGRRRAAERRVRGHEGRQRRRLHQLRQERGAAGDHLECLHAGKRKLRKKTARLRRHEFEIRLPVQRAERLGGRSQYVFARRGRDPLVTIAAFEPGLGPRGDPVKHAAVRPREGKGNVASEGTTG